MKTRHLLSLAMGLCAATLSSVAQPYDLNRVADIAGFTGSDAARELLRKNGFVVADPAFKQIFEPYIKNPMTREPSDQNPRGGTLPSFITVDSAWHTYHVLLEEGVKELEEVQSERLRKFSKQLIDAAREKSLPEIASFAAIDLTLQDPSARASLNVTEKSIVEALLEGSGNVAAPIGFPLSPIQFRAQSFYTQSTELSAYFAARQWYGGVVFRLENPHETDLALKLSGLINSDTNLLALWKQLSDPFDALLALPDDGTVPIYAAAAKAGSPDEVAKKLRGAVPKPLVNDQQLSPEEYLAFDEVTRGFRLLPPRQLPCSICFRKSTDPFIANRNYPSGIDFMVASPTLRSAAAVRAARSQFGKDTADALLKIDAGPLPDSLYGESMKLLSKLQQPLPASVPPAFRSDAWADLQLSTQLSAWAEQRHTWALHTKIAVEYMGLIEPPHGLVAPYPDFFSGLAQLSRDSASALEKAGLDTVFDLKTVATDMFQQMTKSETRTSGEETMSARAEHFADFLEQYYSKHQAETARNPSAYEKLKGGLQTMAEKVSQSGQATPEEAATLKDYYETRVIIANMLKGFAGTCDRLADLATKCRDRKALSEEDATWIEQYGVTLAGYHFYQGNSYEVPADNFPIVTRVYANPRTSSMFYAGLARPQALYVIVDNQLYRGAVMSYREFARPDSELLDDDSWRKLANEGQTPSAPAFTRSFYTERSAKDWLATLKNMPRGDFAPNFSEREDMLWQLGSSATEKDLPGIVELMESRADSDAELTVSLARMIATMPCQEYERHFIELLDSSNTILSDSAALILCQEATNFDPGPIIESFDAKSFRAQRLRIAILGAAPRQTDATGAAMLRALKSQDDGVRWQAAEVIGRAHWSNDPPVSALIESLHDSNAVVAASAVHALARLNATNAGPAAFAELKLRLEHPASAEEIQSQQQAVALQNSDRRMGSGFLLYSLNILDPDNVLMRFGFQNRPMRRGRFTGHPGARPFRLRDPSPPVPGGGGGVLMQNQSDSIDTWIESVGALQCRDAENDLLQLLSTDRKPSAFYALEKLGSPRLCDQMLAKAKDIAADSVERADAIANLCRLNATNQISAITDLLTETTAIPYDHVPPGRQWRICDRAADTIAGLLGWQQRLRMFSSAGERDALVARVKKSLPPVRESSSTP